MGVYVVSHLYVKDAGVMSLHCINASLVFEKKTCQLTKRSATHATYTQGVFIRKALW